jgi:hypothetical protein
MLLNHDDQIQSVFLQSCMTLSSLVIHVGTWVTVRLESRRPDWVLFTCATILAVWCVAHAVDQMLLDRQYRCRRAFWGRSSFFIHTAVLAIGAYRFMVISDAMSWMFWIVQMVWSLLYATVLYRTNYFLVVRETESPHN